MTTEVDFRSVGPAAELEDNYPHPYYLEDLKYRVTVVRVDGALYAFGDMCPHSNCPLSSGRLTGTTVMCQCHGSEFDVTDGAVLHGPATESLATYEARECDGQVQVRI